MTRRTAAGVLVVLLLSAVRCASSPPPSSTPAAEPITPADLVASIADVATGQNADVAAAGLVLKRIEFKLAVGRKTEGGGKVEILLLDAEASRSVETAFVQDFTLEIPAEGRRRAAERPLVPGVREFVLDAMHAARDLARAASEAGLPQRLKGVELTAKLTRSRKLGGGITATFPSVLKPSLGVDVGKTTEEENTLHLIFEATAP
ncbi:MAG TPA: hypothetical protein VGO79_06480 [Thermoanaerobaculia bacterium]|jgi:hypothetical protein